METKCKICGNTTKIQDRIVVRKKYNSTLLKCDHCGFVFVDDPTWLPEAYAEPIDPSDTGYVWRNLWARDQVISILEKNSFNPNGSFLDYGAGFGMFVRLMRDNGFNFLWADKYCKNLFARGFEAPATWGKEIELVTAFEVVEHIPDPLAEFQRICLCTDTFIFSTELIPATPPPVEEWWYYGFMEHGQHISFYSLKTLEYLSKLFEMNFYSKNGIHVFSKKAIFFDEPQRKRNITDFFSRKNKNDVKSKNTRKSLILSDREKILKYALKN